MKRFGVITCFIMFSLSVAVQSRNLVVIDSEDNSPVTGASVIDCSGIISGFTNNRGIVGDISDRAYPLTVRCLGYKSIEIADPVDTLRLAVDTYSLPEVVVKQGERPIIRTISYAREYCTGVNGTDTIQLFSEYMAETFNIESKKVKGYRSYDAVPTIKGIRRVMRRVNAAGLDSVGQPQNNEDFLSFFGNISFIPTDVFAESDSLRSGLVPADTVYGKYAPKRILRKTKNLFVVQNDALADHKGHRWSPAFFKLLGLTMEMQSVNASFAYSPNERGSYGINDFIYGTYSCHILGKGKWIRKMFGADKPVEMDCYVELYPVSTTHITVDEYKELREDWTRIPIESSPLAPPLHPSVQSMIDRVGGGFQSH